MSLIDLHCDTAIRLLYEDLKLKESICSVDINKLKKAKSKAQVFAHFIELDLFSNPYDEFIRVYKNFIKEINENKEEIEVVRNLKELNEANRNNKIGAFLSIEEGEVLEGDIDKIQEVYDLGIRLITLTWNFENSIGYPNSGYKFKDKGLKEKGIEMVLKMEELGIIADCSHLSDGGFYDLVKILKKPFIATHSNAREITDHPRNLTDDMIKALANKGGVMGMNFCAPFMGKSKVTTIESMVRHIEHIRNVGGIDVLAIGGDFDGISNKVEIEDIGEINKLREALIKRGFTAYDIDKIFYKNVERVFKDCLK